LCTLSDVCARARAHSPTRRSSDLDADPAGRRGRGRRHRPGRPVAVPGLGEVLRRLLPEPGQGRVGGGPMKTATTTETATTGTPPDRKSTRLNSSHVKTSYAVFCLK